ncbi:hypothetical protein MUO79_08475 [Candidatus Bathyarchaeota archaeon]|nr:hypothetical protein [Candidatus Bathyarchaeota archaeon]
MYKKILLVSGLVLLLISCVFFTGCTDNSSTTNTTTQITSAPGSPKYVTGDIVRNPAYETAYLILGYNSSTDSYKRALIYPNADGSWGYRTNSNTDTVTRTVLEKTNTEKITNKPPSSIVIRRPTTVATTLVTMTTSTTGIATTTTTTTTTPSPTGKPTFKKIVPDEGTAGTAVSITALTGTNFQSGATVALIKADNPNITATNVNVQSSTTITCTFTLPSNITAGAWDVVITNPDGQYVNYANIFSIHVPVNTATTTSSTNSQGITSISPTSTYGNDVPMTIIGTDFQQGFTAKLTRSTGTSLVIEARTVGWDSPTQVKAWFTLPTPKQRATYNVILTMPDGTTRSLPNGFEVK